MKFLSLSRPWDWAIFDPIARKHLENRTWPPPIAMIGETIALQSARSWDDGAFQMFQRLGLTHCPMKFTDYPSGIIRGVVTIDRVVTEDRTLADEQKRWFFGPYGWVFSDVRPFQSHVACKGAQGLRSLPPDVEAQVRLEIGRSAA